MTKKEIVETIKKMDSAKVINLWNNYVGEKCYPHEDGTIYTNLYGHYNENDNYVIIDESENVQSFTNWDDEKSPVDIDILANYMLEKEN